MTFSRQKVGWPRPLASATGPSAYPHPQPHTLVKLASVSLLQAVRSKSRRACSVSRAGPVAREKGPFAAGGPMPSSRGGCERKPLLPRFLLSLAFSCSQRQGQEGQEGS